MQGPFSVDTMPKRWKYECGYKFSFKIRETLRTHHRVKISNVLAQLFHSYRIAQGGHCSWIVWVSGTGDRLWIIEL
jgi:hypothetical protein